MKKTVLTLGFLTLSLMATDYSSMTNDELIKLRGSVATEDRADFRAEMQSRISTMSTDELVSFRASRRLSQSTTPQTFSTIDRDNDGKITEAELDSARADRLAQQRSDGKLLRNAEESPTLATLDTNGDGTVDRTEFSSYQRVEMANNNQGRRGRGVGQSQPQTFTTIDKDGDGKITESELDSARADREAQQRSDGKLLRNAGERPTLATLDTNGDGTVDATEFSAHQTAQMANRNTQRGAGQGLQDGSGRGSMRHGAGQGRGRGMGQNR